MRHLMLSAATIVLALGVTACEREVRTTESRTVVQQPAPAPEKETIKEKETVVVRPVPVPVPGPAGPAGPAGPEGPQGARGKPGGDTVVIVPPAEPKRY